MRGRVLRVAVVMWLPPVIFAALVIVITLTWLETDLRGLSFWPWKWRAELSVQAERARLRRIGEMEHDLGYVPCSNDRCFPCGAGFWERRSTP